jgi:WD40 repeat protein
MVKEAM